jgi:hypothetical protein
MMSAVALANALLRVGRGQDLHVLHVLLGQRGATLNGLVPKVVGDRPDRPLEVDRAVLVERDSSIATMAVRIAGEIWA